MEISMINQSSSGFSIHKSLSLFIICTLCSVLLVMFVFLRGHLQLICYPRLLF